MNRVTLITGGIRSGKSRYALELARRRFQGPKVFLATAEAFDEEMKGRIANHQLERAESNDSAIASFRSPGRTSERAKEFLTMEEPIHLSHALREAAEGAGFILVDCLTLWVNNLIYHFKADTLRIRNEIRLFVEILESRPASVILVTNEIGSGIIGENPLNRHFADQLGSLNQEIARLSDEVILMVSGIPQAVKGNEIHARLDSAF